MGVDLLTFFAMIYSVDLEIAVHLNCNWYTNKNGAAYEQQNALAIYKILHIYPTTPIHLICMALFLKIK